MKQKILIIEDEKLIVVALKKKLESEGFDVETEYDGVSGLRAALGMHPDLILLDIVLPGIDGVTLLGSLRADEWGAKVPVIILTNLNDASTIEESRKKGVNSYLVKTDWKLNDVVDKVRSTLDEVGGSEL
jgi:DNA-binding response OmpR family regulator